MALTPEDVVNQKFTITKFRDGYDLDQVDDFLDTIVEELRQHEQEKAELRAQIDELTAKLEESEAKLSDAGSQIDVSEQTIVVDAPKPVETPVPVQAEVSHEADAQKSSAMLQLALELHDKHVREGESKRDQLIRDAEATAAELVQEAQKQRAEELRQLGLERTDVSDKIKELREFESEYRSTLRSYIQSQLRGLDGSPEPGNVPDSLI